MSRRSPGLSRGWPAPKGGPHGRRYPLGDSGDCGRAVGGVLVLAVVLPVLLGTIAHQPPATCGLVGTVVFREDRGAAPTEKRGTTVTTKQAVILGLFILAAALAHAGLWAILGTPAPRPIRTGIVVGDILQRSRLGSPT